MHPDWQQSDRLDILESFVGYWSKPIQYSLWKVELHVFLARRRSYWARKWTLKGVLKILIITSKLMRPANEKRKTKEEVKQAKIEKIVYRLYFFSHWYRNNHYNHHHYQMTIIISLSSIRQKQNIENNIKDFKIFQLLLFCKIL